ncbi:hypothetical protein TRFO_26064 [Tritrichomonas foetus]|uniref:Uncharacterized protein n=1 Tax=Tritrichomonas foetus TaxID=1144522 RepID=A0A1J4K982_9EUKA|nr:hypothetical protein TRFO_26064 [Tritrichomonas foetus]|eukprot:OHT05997.1 hypothetical protein TRFO_26064 [Tritrichomonas foetus]
MDLQFTRELNLDSVTARCPPVSISQLFFVERINLPDDEFIVLPDPNFASFPRIRNKPQNLSYTHMERRTATTATINRMLLNSHFNDDVEIDFDGRIVKLAAGTPTASLMNYIDPSLEKLKGNLIFVREIPNNPNDPFNIELTEAEINIPPVNGAEFPVNENNEETPTNEMEIDDKNLDGIFPGLSSTKLSNRMSRNSLNLQSYQNAINKNPVLKNKRRMYIVPCRLPISIFAVPGAQWTVELSTFADEVDYNDATIDLLKKWFIDRSEESGEDYYSYVNKLTKISSQKELNSFLEKLSWTKTAYTRTFTIPELTAKLSMSGDLEVHINGECGSRNFKLENMTIFQNPKSYNFYVIFNPHREDKVSVKITRESAYKLLPLANLAVLECTKDEKLPTPVFDVNFPEKNHGVIPRMLDGSYFNQLSLEQKRIFIAKRKKEFLHEKTFGLVENFWAT